MKGGLVMSNKGSRFLTIVFIIVCASCTKVDNTEEKAVLYESLSRGIVQDNYEKMYQNASDSLLFWKNNKLETYEFLELFPYQLDSLICFNQAGNKMIGAILSSDNAINSHVGDGIEFLYGTEILGKWYFFKGPSIFLPRKMYQKDEHEPLSFAKLHEIAMEEVFGGYLIKKKKDAGWWKNTFNPEYEYEINEEWFTQHFEGLGWGDFNNQAAGDWFLKGKRFKNPKDYYEYIYMEKVRNNWARRN